MSQLVVRRPARIPPPGVPTAEVILATPPRTTRDGAGAMTRVQYLLPLVGGLGSLLFVVSNPRPLYIMGGLIFALGMVGVVLVAFVVLAPEGILGLVRRLRGR